MWARPLAPCSADPIGAIIGRAAGAVAGSLIDQSFFGTTRRIEGPRINDLRVMSASEGAPIPRLWGRMRVAGQVIWATNFEEVVVTHTDKTSSKGGGSATRITEYEYFANFAVALCEGEIDRIGRVWADGKEFDISELTTRHYTGSPNQEPDSLIVAKEGADNAPAYRGTAYIVFERMPVTAFGNRLPQLSFEVFRFAGGAEEHVKGGQHHPRQHRVRLRHRGADPRSGRRRDRDRERPCLGAPQRLDRVDRRSRRDLSKSRSGIAGGGLVRRRSALWQY